MRALIVDDSKPVRSILAKMLVDLGYECEQASDGQEALLILGRGWRPDVATVNLHMPVMDGFEARSPLLPEVFALHGRWRRERDAVVCGGQRERWGEFTDRLSRFANALHGRGMVQYQMFGAARGR
jgi:hypothetical protein